MVLATLFGALMLIQASVTPVLTPAMSAQAAGPQFALDCPNPQPFSIPEHEPLNDIVLRIDGKDVPPPSGGIIGSIPGTIGVNPVIDPEASVRVHLTLAQGSAASVRSGRFGSRFTVSRLVPLQAGRHRLAVRCLGQWSNEVTFGWEP